MSARARTCWRAALLLWVSGCARPAEPTQSPPDSGGQAVTQGASTPQAATIEPTHAPPSAEPTADATASSSAAGGPVAPTSRCSKHADCGWNDACFPTQCRLGARPVQACDESAPPPGRCDCLAGECAVVYKAAPATCATDADCSWDDPCTPRSCGKRQRPNMPAVCDKSFPAPGDCRCLNRVCASVSR